MTDDGKKLSTELQDRLDDLFSEPDDDEEIPAQGSESEMMDIDGLKGHDRPPAEKHLPSAAATPDPPLLDLRATILSLDWEITDATLNRLLSEISHLKTVYQNDKLPFMFLQLLGSIGKYISVKKVKAHPDSIKMLHSVYAGFEQVLLNAEISDLEKKKILSNEVRQFKSLKQRIRHTSPEPVTAVRIPDIASPVLPSEPSAGKPPPTKGVTPSSLPGEQVSIETMLTEIRKVIRDEFEAVKTELRAMLGEE